MDFKVLHNSLRGTYKKFQKAPKMFFLLVGLKLILFYGPNNNL